MKTTFDYWNLRSRRKVIIFLLQEYPWWVALYLFIAFGCKGSMTVETDLQRFLLANCTRETWKKQKDQLELARKLNSLM